MNEAETAAGLTPTPMYRYAQRVGNQLFVAGQVPMNSRGHLITLESARSETEQCLRNLELLLSVHDFSIAHVRQLVLYVVGDKLQLEEVWSAVAAWFSGEVPPATVLGVARLGYEDQLVELDATVVKEQLL